MSATTNTSSVKRIGVLIGTTRTGRVSPLIAQFVLNMIQQQYNELIKHQQQLTLQQQSAQTPLDAASTTSYLPSVLPFTCVFELIDIASFQLPLLDDIILPAHQQSTTTTTSTIDSSSTSCSVSYPYTNTATRLFSSRILSCAALIIISAQYNWSIPACLKNALDHLYHEWHGKPTIIATFGHHGGNKCSAHLVQVCEGSLKMKVMETKPMMVLKRTINSMNDVVVSQSPSPLSSSASKSTTTTKMTTTSTTAPAAPSSSSFSTSNEVDISTVLDNLEEAIAVIHTSFRHLLNALI